MTDCQNSFDGLPRFGRDIACGVAIIFQRNFLCASQAFIRRDNKCALAICNSACQGLGTKAAKDDTMDCANARAGQHGESRL